MDPHGDEDLLRDHVTGLPNAALLRDRLRMALVRRRRPRFDSLAVIYIEVGELDALTERHGGDVVQGVLRAAAARLSECLRVGDTVSRIADAEFVLLCEELGGDEESLVITERVVRAFEQPLTVGDTTHHVSIGVGLVVIAGGEMDLERVLDEARRAMRRGRDDDSSRFS